MGQKNLMFSTFAKPSGCDNQLVMKDINQAHELASQLRVVLLSSLPVGSSAELAQEILDKLIKCSTLALSRLQSCGCRTICHKESFEKRKNSGKHNDGYKRRKTQNSWSTVTSIPYHDGHCWRKYGQKNINNSKYPRSYYRCVYLEDQGCPATRTVQQEDSDSDPPKFTVVYNMQHTCKSTDTNIAFVMDSSESDRHLPPPCIATANQSQTSSPLLVSDQDIIHTLISEQLRKEMPIGSPGIIDEIMNTSLPADPWNLDNNNWGDGGFFEFNETCQFESRSFC